MIKQQVVNKTPAGASMKSYIARDALGKPLKVLQEESNIKICFFHSIFIVPDSLVMPLIRDRLGQRDCITKGWIMIGFPRTREQAESLARIPALAPSR